MFRYKNIRVSKQWVFLGVRVSGDLARSLDEVCRRQDRQRSSVLRNALKAYIKSELGSKAA